jgi:hypothetical protein
MASPEGLDAAADATAAKATKTMIREIVRRNRGMRVERPSLRTT